MYRSIEYENTICSLATMQLRRCAKLADSRAAEAAKALLQLVVRRRSVECVKTWQDLVPLPRRLKHLGRESAAGLL